mgnify:CR=1 FL=1
MEYVYGALLLHYAKQEINEENLTQVLTAAGVNVDAVRVKALVASLAEVNIDEVIKSAPSMMTAPATPTAATAGAAAPSEAKPKEEEKKKEEKKEEEALEGLAALFG